VHIGLSLSFRVTSSMQRCRVHLWCISVFGSIKGVLWHPVCIKLIFLCPRVANRMPAVKCVHLKRRERCVECGGSEICSHGKRKSQCADCGGKGICQHGRSKYACKDCGGSAFCQHGRRKAECGQCLNLFCPVEDCPRHTEGFSKKKWQAMHIKHYHPQLLSDAASSTSGAPEA